VTFGSVGGRPYVPGIPVGTVISVTTRAGLAHPDRAGPAVRDFTGLGVVGVVVQVPKHNPRVSILPRPAPTVTITVTPSPSSSASLAPGTLPSPAGGASPSSTPSPAGGASPSSTPSPTGGGG
jgi:rod shape-determining protein MreC